MEVRNCLVIATDLRLGRNGFVAHSEQSLHLLNAFFHAGWNAQRNGSLTKNGHLIDN